MIRQRPVVLHRRLIDVRHQHPSLVMDESVDRGLLRKLVETLSTDTTVRRYSTEMGRLNGRASYEQANYSAFAPDGYFGSVYVGRMFTKTSEGVMSMQAQKLPRVARNSLFRHTHDEIDISCCMPTLVAHLFRHLPLEALPVYLDAQERAELVNGLHVSQAVLKDVVLKILNGMRAPWGLEPATVQLLVNAAFIRRLQRDVQSILGELERLYPLFVDMVRRKKTSVRDQGNVLVSALNVLYQDLENEVLITMVHAIQERVPDCSNMILMFDGLLVPKAVTGDADLLPYLMESVFDSTGVMVNLVQKEMEPFLPNVVPGEDEPEQHQLENVARVYDEWKGEFERHHYFLRDSSTCVKLTAEGPRHYKVDYFKNGVCVEEPADFIKDWLADKTKRAYLREDFLPPPLEVPEGVLNTYVGLFPEQLPEIAADRVEELVAPILRHCAILAGEQSVEGAGCQYLLKWLALRVQQPANRPLVALGFRSKEGVGKDSFFEWFGTKILGPSYFLNFPELGLLFSAQMRSSVQDKLLITISEVTRADHKSTMHKLKGFLTDKFIMIRKLYCEPYSRLNLAAVVMFSQDGQFLDLDTVGDRRYQLFNCIALEANRQDYFQPLFAAYGNNEVVRAFYQYLKAIDITNFHCSRDRVTTDIQANMARYSCSPLVIFLLKFLPLEEARQIGRRQQDYVSVSNADLRAQFAIFLAERYPATFQDMAKLSQFRARMTTLMSDSMYKEEGVTKMAISKVRITGVNHCKFHFARIMGMLREMAPPDDTFEEDD